MLTTIEKQHINKAAMDVELMETSRTTDLRKLLGVKINPTSNTLNNRDSQMNNDVQQEPVTADDETVVQGTMGEDMQKTKCKVKISFTSGDSTITSFLSALRGFFNRRKK